MYDVLRTGVTRRLKRGREESLGSSRPRAEGSRGFFVSWRGAAADAGGPPHVRGRRAGAAGPQGLQRVVRQGGRDHPLLAPR